MKRLVSSPVDPRWLIPEGWETVLGAELGYRLGDWLLRLWQIQLNQHPPQEPVAPQHAHPRHQLLYYQKGAGQLTAGTRRHQVRGGSVFLLPAGCRHRFESRAEDGTTCFALEFTLESAGASSEPDQTLSEAAILLSLVHTGRARPFQIQVHDQERLDRCIAELVRENERREAGYATLIQARLLEFVGLCLRATQRAEGFRQHFRHTEWRHRLVVDRAMSLIREEAARQPELTLAEAGRRCAASPNHLNRILKKETGQTFHQNLLRRRLEMARALLEEGRLNCTEAALEAGFNDSNYFSRAFRKLFGHRPSDLARGA
jgi:AraC family L-rhamnose operon regulatory protein RhaS